MEVRKMSVKQWIAVMNNPIQRDTERHAAKAKHLMTPLAIHASVNAARLINDPQYPMDTMVKLDGHTRALMWSRNQIKHPAEIFCTIYTCKNMEEAMELYRTFDSRDALETTTDKVLGAFGSHQFHPESGLLKSGNITSAMKMCWNVRDGVSAHHTSLDKTKRFDIYKAVDEFTNELLALDHFGIGTGTVVPSGIVAAFILTYRRHGKNAINFWQAYFADAGTKSGGRMDGVQALHEYAIAMKGKYSGGSRVVDMASKAVMCVEKWLKEEDFGQQPRAFDLTGYIDHKKPDVQLIQAHKIASNGR